MINKDVLNGRTTLEKIVISAQKFVNWTCNDFCMSQQKLGTDSISKLTLIKTVSYSE